MYFALESGVRGGPSASGSQKGQSHSEQALTWVEREIGREE
jgi:hypothetical protein